MEMQLIYLIEIIEDNYDIVHDCFETDSINVIKNRWLVQREISIYISLSESTKKL